ELPQTRIRAAEVNKDMTLRIGRDTNGFAKSLAGWNLQKIWNRGVWNLGNILCRRFQLCEGRNRRESQERKKNNRERAFHWKPPFGRDRAKYTKRYRLTSWNVILCAHDEPSPLHFPVFRPDFHRIFGGPDSVPRGGASTIKTQRRSVLENDLGFF